MLNYVDGGGKKEYSFFFKSRVKNFLSVKWICRQVHVTTIACKAIKFQVELLRTNICVRLTSPNLDAIPAVMATCPVVGNDNLAV